MWAIDIVPDWAGESEQYWNILSQIGIYLQFCLATARKDLESLSLSQALSVKIMSVQARRIIIVVLYLSWQLIQWRN